MSRTYWYKKGDLHPTSLMYSYKFDSPSGNVILDTNPYMQPDIYYHYKTPPNWKGKLLVRVGQKPPPNWSRFDAVMEESLPLHDVIGPNKSSNGYNPTRMLIYVDGKNMIEHVRYG